MANGSWETTLLDRMRLQGDAAADAVAEDFIRAGRVGELNAVLGKIQGCGDAFAGAPPKLRAFLEQNAQLPAWADAARIRQAQNLFSLHGPVFGVVMLFKSLPVLYAGGRGGAQVLTMTGKLTHHYRQRASETLRFILDVMEPGGLGPGGRGLHTALRVRLLHASIRGYAGATPEWNAHRDWGRPINQEELAGTLLAFSVLTLDGVTALGVRLSPAEVDAYLHAWKVIGHVLGLDEALMPRSLAEARELWAVLERRNFFRTDDGVRLMDDHVKFLEQLLPGGLLDRGIPVLVRYLMGHRISNLLDVPQASPPLTFVFFLRDLLKLERVGFWLFPALSRAGRDISIKLMEGLQRYWNDGHSQPFHIPNGVKG